LLKRRPKESHDGSEQRKLVEFHSSVATVHPSPDGNAQRQRELFTATGRTSIGELMTREVVTVTVHTPQAELARLIAKHDFLALPVLSNDGALVGIVTVDDVTGVMIEGFNKNIAKMVGTDADEIDRRSPAQVAKLSCRGCSARWASNLGRG
jgi:signal-transduction protein with cAMP-binding, CBS, and nucleotidyltransferase domain